MSRYMESGTDEKGLWYFETLADANGCRYMVNEVCCNAGCKEMLGDFPGDDYCRNCKHFFHETQMEIDVLKDGVKTYE